MPEGHRREVARANEITRRTTLILSAAGKAGAEFAIENPADRGDHSQQLLFQFAEHGPIWLDPHMVALKREHHLQAVTFAQCMLGGSTQKYTTIWHTPGLREFYALRGMICRHSPGTHASVAGGKPPDADDPKGKWNSAAAAAYPADMNLFIADAIFTALVRSEFQSEPSTRSTPNPSSRPRAEPPPTALNLPETKAPPSTAELRVDLNGPLRNESISEMAVNPSDSTPPEEALDEDPPGSDSPVRATN